MFSLPAYLPPPPEDDVQQARNKLKREGLGAEERAALLSLTFPDRRQHAVAMRTPMKKFLHLYPALKDYDEVGVTEIGRICRQSEIGKIAIRRSPGWNLILQYVIHMDRLIIHYG